MAGPLPIGQKVPEHGLLTQEEISGSSSRSFHAYVHIPFCTVRCGYCDFNTYTASELNSLRQSDYAKSVISEVLFSKEVLDRSGVKSRPLHSVFFGGGTPSLLPALDLIAILDSLKREFGLTDGAEVTLEANPDTVTESSLEALRHAGFNRISIGMQSADPDTLKVLDRTHLPDNVKKAIEIAKGLEFRTSLDLIFGTPGETLESWGNSLGSAIELEPDHVSAYGLIVETGTKLARKISSGELEAVDEDLQAEKYELAEEVLASNGFGWYEISNWAKSSLDQSRHNLAYWQGQDWWGYGPGAHSHIGSVRFWNEKYPATYAKSLQDFRSPAAAKEYITVEMDALERVMLEIRTVEGIKISYIESILPNTSEVVAGLIAEGLVDGRQALSGVLRLTLAGRLLADEVVRRLTP